MTGTLKVAGRGAVAALAEIDRTRVARTRDVRGGMGMLGGAFILG